MVGLTGASRARARAVRRLCGSVGIVALGLALPSVALGGWSMAPTDNGHCVLGVASNGTGLYRVGGLEGYGGYTETAEAWLAGAKGWSEIDPLPVSRYGVGAAFSTDGHL